METMDHLHMDDFSTEIVTFANCEFTAKAVDFTIEDKDS